MNPRLEERHVRMLRQFVEGAVPRCSQRDWEALYTIKELRGCLQRESAAAADTRQGYVLTPLHGGWLNKTDITKVREWLVAHGHLPSESAP
jgi:hypothetical protein